MPAFRSTLCALALSGLIAGPAAAKEVCYFGVCKDVPAAPATPAPTPTTSSGDTGVVLKVLASYGSWQVVTDGKGHRALIDTFDDGSRLLVTKVDDEFEIVIREPTWHLGNGDAPAVKVDIDGSIFTGATSVVDRQTVAIRHLTEKFVKALFGGERARVAIGDESWTLSLTDAASAMDAASKSGGSTTS